MTDSIDDRYALTQRVLHWLIAVMVLGLLAGGWIMTHMKAKDLPDGLYNMIYAQHKNFGVIIIVLMLLRIIARLIHGAPAPHVGLANWQRTASSVVHIGFYALLIIQPVLGLIGTWSFPAPIPLLDGLGIDNPFTKDRELSKTLFELHEIVGKALIVLAVLHIGGAFLHIFKRDGVFRPAFNY
jgi:cytochrome b561